MPSKVDGRENYEDTFQTTTVHPTSDFDQLLNDDAALLDFMVSTILTVCNDHVDLTDAFSSLTDNRA